MSKKKIKDMLAGFLTIGMIVSGISFMPITADAASGSVYGTNGTYEDAISYEDITSEFKSLWKAAGKGTAPTKTGYIFGGWFKKDGSSYTALDEAACTSIITDEGSTTAVYAKFVPAYVLSVKAQINSDTKQANDGAEASIRLVSSVDALDYQTVGFEVWLNNKYQVLQDGKPLETQQIFKGLKVGSQEQPYEAKDVFGSVSQYFSVWRLTGIKDANDSKIINVTPYWITKDGTKVEGLTKYVHVEDGYLGYVSVPVNLTNTDAVAAGALQMSYDSSILKFQDVEFDGVFPSTEMEYQDDGAGVLRFVGSAATTGTNVTADGIYANVRFKVVSGSTYAGVGSGQFLGFEVTKEKFCNWDRTLVTIDAWDIQY